MTLTVRLAPTISAQHARPLRTGPGEMLPHSAFRILRGTHDFADIFMLCCVFFQAWPFLPKFSLRVFLVSVTAARLGTFLQRGEEMPVVYPAH